MSELKTHVEEMVRKAGSAKNSNDALKFSQAACNAANALRVLGEVKSGNAEK